jgi:hypothetical protein
LQPNWIDADLTILAAAEQSELDFSHNPIVFDGGVPVGGWSTLTLHSDGSYVFSGHFHDSGATEYNTAFAWAVADSQKNVYTFQHQGKVTGTFESGSRDDDWTITGQNDVIAQNWGSLVIANFAKYQDSADGDLTNLMNSLMSAVGTALGGVGIVLAIVLAPVVA